MHIYNVRVFLCVQEKKRKYERKKGEKHLMVHELVRGVAVLHQPIISALSAREESNKSS
jgi:hypothetical protein